MANEFDDLRSVLTSKALAVATDLGVQIQMPNGKELNVENAIYLNFWYKLGRTGQAELGGPAALEVSAGLLQFDVLVPERTGDGGGWRVANQIKKKINRKQWLVGSHGYVSLDAANIETDLPVAKDGWYRLCVDATFTFYHRNPDADPLPDF